MAAAMRMVMSMHPRRAGLRLHSRLAASGCAHGRGAPRSAACSSLSRADVESLLDPRALIDALATAMADLSAGRASMPNRVAAMVRRARRAARARCPATCRRSDALTAKLVTLFRATRTGRCRRTRR